MVTFFHRLLIKPLYQGLQDPRGHPEKKAPRGTRGSRGKRGQKDHEVRKDLKEKKALLVPREFPGSKVKRATASP